MPQASFLTTKGAKPVPPAQTGEEKAPDLGNATKSQPATPLTEVVVSSNPDVAPLFEYFVDGVQRTVAIAQVEVGGVIVPVHMAHVAAGAMRRINGVLAPHLIRQAVILIMPHQAMANRDPEGWGPVGPPGVELTGEGNIYGAIQNASISSEFFSDTSVLLKKQAENVAISPGDLVSTGLVRQAALNRANELMRILELGVLWELRKNQPEGWILLDGPIAPLTKYARLVVPELEGLQSIANPSQAFDFFKRMVGAVKEIRIVPSTGLDKALAPGVDIQIPTFRFSDTVEQTDEIAKEVLSAFVYLRKELSEELSPIWSAASGLARYDIPLPAVLPDDPGIKNTWHLSEDALVAGYVAGNHTDEEFGLKSILESIVLERWPVPAATPTRILVELYPIAETELWLMASLFDGRELQARGMFG